MATEPDANIARLSALLTTRFSHTPHFPISTCQRHAEIGLSFDQGSWLYDRFAPDRKEWCKCFLGCGDCEEGSQCSSETSEPPHPPGPNCECDATHDCGRLNVCVCK